MYWPQFFSLLIYLHLNDPGLPTAEMLREPFHTSDSPEISPQISDTVIPTWSHLKPNVICVANSAHSDTSINEVSFQLGALLSFLEIHG